MKKNFLLLFSIWMGIILAFYPAAIHASNLEKVDNSKEVSSEAFAVQRIFKVKIEGRTLYYNRYLNASSTLSGNIDLELFFTGGTPPNPKVKDPNRKYFVLKKNGRVYKTISKLGNPIRYSIKIDDFSYGNNTLEISFGSQYLIFYIYKDPYHYCPEDNTEGRTRSSAGTSPRTSTTDNGPVIKPGCGGHRLAGPDSESFENSESTFKLYPNPTNTYMTIEVPMAEFVGIKIVNSSGKILKVPFQNKDFTSRQVITLETNLLTRGLYQAIIQGNDQTYISTFQKN